MKIRSLLLGALALASLLFAAPAMASPADIMSMEMTAHSIKADLGVVPSFGATYASRTRVEFDLSGLSPTGGGEPMPLFVQPIADSPHQIDWRLMHFDPGRMPA